MKPQRWSTSYTSILVTVVNIATNNIIATTVTFSLVFLFLTDFRHMFLIHTVSMVVSLKEFSYGPVIVKVASILDFMD